MSSLCGAEITSEEYADVISGYRLDREEIFQPDASCINIINERWAVLSYPLESHSQVSFETSGYFRIPKLFAPMDMTSMEASGVTRLISNPNLSYTGKDVLVGLIDTGIDYAHPVFRNAQGGTRVQAIWDQTDQTGQSPFGIGYGSVYMRNEINEALRQENPYEYISGDIEDGHGTFLAGIAAGSHIDGEFQGAAPDADIAMVKLKPAKTYLRDFYKISENAIAYSETDIMFGIKFLNLLAASLSKPLVILVAMGNSNGPHNGDTPLGDYMKTVSLNNGVVMVTAVGNEGNGRRHYEGQLETGQEQVVEINVGEGEQGFLLELWADNPDVYSVGIVSPSGEEIPRIPAFLGGSTEVGFIFEATRIKVDYMLVETISGKFLITMLFNLPSPGIWRIRVFGNQVLLGRYNMWLPVGQFLRADTYFLNPNPFVTLTTPSGGVQLLSVAAYDHYGGGIDIDSGRGYNSDGAVKPDLAAPGVNVYGPVPGGGFARRTGTSIGAAHVAGCSALLLEWGVIARNQRFMNTEIVKNYLIKGANRSSNRVYPDRYFGYGTLDIYNVFESLRVR